MDPYSLVRIILDVGAVVSLQRRDLRLAVFVVEVASDSELTVRATAATDTNTLAVAVKDLRLEAGFDGPYLERFLERDKCLELLVGFDGGHGLWSLGRGCCKSKLVLSRYVGIKSVVILEMMGPPLQAHSSLGSGSAWHEGRAASIVSSCGVAVNAVTFMFAGTSTNYGCSCTFGVSPQG